MAVCVGCGSEFDPLEEGDVVRTLSMEERIVWTNGMDPGVPGYRERRGRSPVRKFEPRCGGCI